MKTNWEDIKLRYITTDVSLKELASEFDLSESSLGKRAAAEKWTDERKKHYKKVEQKTEEKIAEIKAEAYAEITKLSCEGQKLFVEKAIDIAKGIDAEDKTNILYIHKCQKTVESAVATMDKIMNPQHEENKDNTIRLVVGDDIKEYAK